MDVRSRRADQGRTLISTDPKLSSYPDILQPHGEDGEGVTVRGGGDAAGSLGPSTEDQVREGFKLYNEACVYCHGAPGKDPVDIGKGLNPEPRYLADTVGRWTAPELFWIVKNGIRMTGMPSFGKTHEDAEIKAAVAFIQRLPQMTPVQYGEFEKQ